MPFSLVAITERALCPEPLPTRVAALIAAGFDAVILREKDLGLAAYTALARQVIDALEHAGLPWDRLILHGAAGARAATALGLPQQLGLHLPLGTLRAERPGPGSSAAGRPLGASVHSVAEAQEAQRLGAGYLMAGHVFATACKPGLPPRGLPFVREVCAAVDVPVWAVGGLSAQTVGTVAQAGARGACLRGPAMETPLSELPACAAGLRAAVRGYGGL